MNGQRLYWGDLHSHCSVSYGHGTAEQAIARARQQLDFCSITGHAFWPDMTPQTVRYPDIIDYHIQGFATLAKNWNELLRVERQGTDDGQFVALPSYEWHSLKYGDHNVYGPGPELPLENATDLSALRDVVRRQGSLAIPHHIGYAAGFRGIDWDHFSDELSPFVEIFSLHGCSLDEHAPYPMLHDMGPRDFGSTAEAGWRRGHRFGIVGGTDHHAAYPGSHGDGRMGVFATANTREALFEAFRARRVYAATGDKIDARLIVDGACIGSSICSAKARHLRVAVCGLHTLDQVQLIKNDRILARFFPDRPGNATDGYRLRITWGWGRKSERHDWEAELTVSEGEIRQVEPCFSGQAVVSPQAESVQEPDLPHAIMEHTGRSVVWRSVTSGNISMRHGTTQSLSLHVVAPLDATVTIHVNGIVIRYRLSDLLNAGRSTYLRGWLTEAIRVGPLVPLGDCSLDAELLDEPDQAVDRYRLQVAQTNGQYAWLTPIWADR